MHYLNCKSATEQLFNFLVEVKIQKGLDKDLAVKEATLTVEKYTEKGCEYILRTLMSEKAKSTIAMLSRYSRIME